MKKKIISIITTMLITGSLAMNTYASNLTNVTEFTDYDTLQSHWGLNDINVLVSKNGIRGIPNDDGTFRFEPDREITTAELLSLILNAAGIAPTDGEWPTNVMEKAASLGLIKSAWNTESVADSPIPRERMAYTLYNTAAHILNEDINKSDYDVDPAKIGDIVGNEYQRYIKDVYDFGLIAGTGEGFNPSGNTTRAEASAIVNRLFRYTDRVDNSALEYDRRQPSYNTDPGFKPEYDYDNNGMITEEDLIKMQETANYPEDGDIINGVAITRDPETGVLGYGNGQKGGIWLGVKRRSGNVFKVMSEMPMDCKDPLVNGYYEQHGDYVYWTAEWRRIGAVMIPKLREMYPNAPAGTCADIYGNILNGVINNGELGSEDGVFFSVNSDGQWVSIGC